MNRGLFEVVFVFLFLSPVIGFAGDKNYPVEIVALHLQDKYDEAKWLLYCIHSDDKLKYWDSKTVSEKTFGELPLKFDMLEILSDSVAINFRFYDKGVELNGSVIENYLLWGVVFKAESNKTLCYTTTGGFKYLMNYCSKVPDEKCNLREVNPLQPEVINYIQTNKDKNNPWFRQEAIRRGVIK